MKLIKEFFKSEVGAIQMNTQSIFMIIMAVMMAVIAFNVFPNVLTGAESIRTHSSASSYTGLTTSVAIGPTVLFLAMLFGSIVTGFYGFKGAIGGSGGGKHHK